MSRYIDADDIEIVKFQEENLRGTGEHIAFRVGWNEAIESILENASSIEIVRCRECKYYLPMQKNSPYAMRRRYCNKGAIKATSPDDFCSYGEREGE